MKNYRYHRLLVLIALLPLPAYAADNAVVMTAGSGITFRSVDVGSGVQSPMHILGNSSGTTIYGTAGTANAAVLSVQGIASGTALGISGASGAFASGAFASGSVASGAMVDLGAIADAASTAGGTGTLSAKLRLMTTQLDTISSAIASPIPSCSASPCTTVIGAVVPYQGTAVLSISNPSFSRSVAGATGGGTISSAIAPATPAGVNLKASAGTVFKVFATTIQATPVYVKLYNASSAPTCGSGTPVARFMVPVASTAANGAGTNIDIGDIGAAFGTGIGYCVTGALADNDTTAITTNNTLVNIVWN